GYAPQNLFRLLSRSAWDNVRFSADFRIMRDTFTESPSRNESNGLFLMSGYKDENNLYYAGVRVDGRAIIAKKVQGTYYTMAKKSVFDGEYVREKDTNLLPHHAWIGLRSETLTSKDGKVTLKLFIKTPKEQTWIELLSATDDGAQYALTAP